MVMDKEKWADVKGYNNYQVSDRGRVRGGRFPAQYNR